MFAHAALDSKGPTSNTGQIDDPAPPRRVLLKTAKINVTVDGVSQLATVLFDEGSDRSFISAKFAQTLRASPNYVETLNLKSFSNPRTGFRTIPRTTVHLQHRDGTKSAIDLLMVDVISEGLDNNVTYDIRNLHHIRRLPLAHPPSTDLTMDIDILIGVDRYWDYITGVVRQGNPVAVSSLFGYLLSGPIYTHRRRTRHNNAHTFHIASVKSTDIEMDNRIATYWDLETIGIKDTIAPNIPKPCSDEQYKTYTEHSLTTEDGRYTAKLPWKPDHPILPTNFKLAEIRTRNMLKIYCLLIYFPYMME
ncbi:uncharacterized protein LOC144353209 [Saccoglossus kowalevskii]